MYGLPHVTLAPQQQLEKQLNKRGYTQSKLTSGFWTHKWHPISFSLCVDNFGVKCVGKQHGNHLMAVLQEYCNISNNWNGKLYLSLDLDWDYNNTYVTAALTCFNHTHPCKSQGQPYPHIKLIYGAKAQYINDTDTSPPHTSADKKSTQEVTGTVLYHAWVVDHTILTALKIIATQQSNPTEQTMQQVKQFLEYTSTHPDAIITHHARNMALAGHSNVLYLSKSKARSRAGGHFFLSNNTEYLANNGSVLTLAVDP